MSKLHGGLDDSGSAIGQTPGLDANSLDRFRAGGVIQMNYISIKSRLSWQRALPKGRPGLPQHLLQQGVVAHAQKCSGRGNQKFKVTLKLEAILEYTRPCLKCNKWVREVVQGFRVLAVFAEDQLSVPSTLMVAHSHL